MIELISLKLKLIFCPCQENQYRPKFLASRFLYYYAVLLLILKISIIPLFVYFPKSIFFADITKTALVELLNQTRISAGLQPLKVNPLLEKSAYLKALDMFEKNYFAHNSPEGITPWYWFQSVGYNYQFAGENLAIGFVDSEEVHTAWFNSPPHRENLLNPRYQEVGIAVLTGEFKGKEVPIVVQHFGTSKLSISPQQTKPEQKKEVLPEKTEKLPEGAEEEKEEIIPEEKETEEIALQPEPIETKEILSSYISQEDKNSFPFKFISFLTSDYYNLLQKIIYLSLIFIIISLFITVFCDLFIYRAFEIQYKDILFKAVSFCILFLVLLFIDKGIIIQIIPHEFSIF